MVDKVYSVSWITFRYLIDSSISDEPNRKLRTTEIKKLKTDLADAIRGKEYETASKIQAKIDNLEKKTNERILQGKDFLWSYMTIPLDRPKSKYYWLNIKPHFLHKF